MANEDISAGTFDMSIFMKAGNIGRAKSRNISTDAIADIRAVVVISLAVKDVPVSVGNVLKPPRNIYCSSQ
jgi:hypothetical protein